MDPAAVDSAAVTLYKEIFTYSILSICFLTYIALACLFPLINLPIIISGAILYLVSKYCTATQLYALIVQAEDPLQQKWFLGLAICLLVFTAIHVATTRGKKGTDMALWIGFIVATVLRMFAVFSRSWCGDEEVKWWDKPETGGDTGSPFFIWPLFESLLWMASIGASMPEVRIKEACCALS